MSKQKKTWVYRPQKPAAPRVPENLKAKVQQQADALIETALKPRHVKPPPADSGLNYIVDLYAKWYGRYFYFYAKYASPGPHSIAPFFEIKFARMEYTGGKSFTLSALRHTGQWIEMYPNVTLEECWSIIQTDAWFEP